MHSRLYGLVRHTGITVDRSGCRRTSSVLGGKSSLGGHVSTLHGRRVGHVRRNSGTDLGTSVMCLGVLRRSRRLMDV